MEVCISGVDGRMGGLVVFGGSGLGNEMKTIANDLK